MRKEKDRDEVILEGGLMDALALSVSTIAGFEGCRLGAYQDVAGVWTIGWGETAGVQPGQVWTREQADAALRLRVKQFLADVLQRCPALRGAPPQRIAACVSLAYNIGASAFGASSVCRNIMAGNLSGAADSFLLWDKAGGRKVPGLARRRAAERTLFLAAGL
jgi:lysozyme